MSFLENAERVVPPLSIEDCEKALSEIQKYSLRGHQKPATFDDLVVFQWAAIGWRDRLSELESAARSNVALRERCRDAAKQRYELKLHAQIRLDPVVKEQKNQKLQIAEAQKNLSAELKDLEDAEESLVLMEIYQKQVYNRLQEMSALAKDLTEIGMNMSRSRSLSGGPGTPISRAGY